MRSPLFRVLTSWLLLTHSAALLAQALTAVPAVGLRRVEGTDPENHVAYVRILLSGRLVPAVEITLQPTLTAQCTKQLSGKAGFELYANFGGIDDFAYHRPWMPKDGGMFPPMTKKVSVMMEFLGYTKVKPVKRQWERVEEPEGQLRYNPPSTGSSNMEEITYFLQYLRALPSLRLTYAGKTAEFYVTPLFEQLRKEPVCHASGL